jgi:lipopolysaccharide kinase (Kdo/WaaP) family protein
VLLTEFNVEKRGRTTIWISPSFVDPKFVDALADVDQLLEDPRCEIIKDQRKIKIGSISVNVAGQIRSIYIKKYKAFSFRYSLFSLFFRSGTLRAVEGASVLAEAGIASAMPVAAVEERVFGCLQRSFFISEGIANAITTVAYWNEKLRRWQGQAGFTRRRLFLSALAALFNDLHGRRIYHNDLKDANIMAVSSGNDDTIRFSLLDLEGVRRCSRLSRRRKVKNLVQIYRTLGRHLSRSQQLFFLKRYLELAPRNRIARRDLINRVLSRAKRIDDLKAFKKRTSYLA